MVRAIMESPSRKATYRQGKMPMMLKSFTIGFVGLLAIQAQAYEPPQYGLEEAISRAESIFIGRIINIKEDEVGEYSVRATATVMLIECIKNVDCSKNRTLKMHFYSQTHVDRAFPVNFSISTNVLFPMRKRVTSNTVRFNSNWNDGIDIAYVISDPELKTTYPDAMELTLSNIYLPSVREQVTMKKIRDLVSGLE